MEKDIKKGQNYTGITVVFLCHDGQGNYLFGKRGGQSRDEAGVWDAGGGALEFGETIEDTLKREIREEYGTEVLDYQFLGFRDVHRVIDGHKTHWVALDFKVLVDRSKVKNGEPHKLDEIGWFTVDQFPEPNHSQFPAFLEKHKGKI